MVVYVVDVPLVYNMNKNKYLLDSFVEYCNEHPDHRFWQALRNWSGNHFIMVKQYCGPLKDTFYWEGKNGFEL